MKKVLFLSTALIASASMAAAEVRISGYGRFGLDYNNDNGDPAPGAVVGDEINDKTSITSRLRLQFDMSTETDGGITFGARYRAQAESRDNNPGGATFNGGRFFASTGGFTVQVGNILGALENSRGLYLETRTAGVGIDGAGFESVVTNIGGNAFDWDAYSSAGAGVNGLEVLYDGDNFGVHVSYSKRDDRVGPGGIGTVTDGEQNTAISGYYSFGDWTVALGYNDEKDGTDAGGPDNDLIFASVSGDLGIFGVRLAYAQMKDIAGIAGDKKGRKIGLYGNFDIGASTNLLAYVTREDADDLITDGTGYGLHVSHDLGGGVSFEAGARRSSSENTTVQAGVYFSF